MGRAGLPLVALLVASSDGPAAGGGGADGVFSFELPPVPLSASGGIGGARAMRQGGGSAGGHGAAPWSGGLNAKDYGAVGDGVADDAPALQKAIDAAMELGRALLLPAGVYRINSTLSILSSARSHYTVPGPGYAKHPLRLIGEGYALTRISAAVKMHALLNYSCNNSVTYGAAAPVPSENQFVSDMCLDAGGLANYSVFAPGIARSRFERVEFSGALSVGASIGYGWCNCKQPRDYSCTAS